MTFIAFISTALLTLVIGWWFGIYCGRKATLDESEKKPALSPNVDNKKVKISFATTDGPIELEGTKGQLNTFMAEIKKRDEALYPRFVSYKDTISLAVGCGLSVKELTK